MKPATTITKVCRVLSEFRTRPSLGITDLARRTNLLPSDVHRILTSLQLYGFIEQNAHNKTYRLGVGLLKLGLTVFQRSEMREAALPLLRKLSEQMEATAHMAIFDMRDLDIFLVEQIDSREETPIPSRLGAVAGPHCTALGKTIVANLERETALRLLLKHGTPRRTQHTITGARELESELHRIQQQGYGLDREESLSGTCCIGAPVFGPDGATIGAISVSMMAGRFYRSQEAQLAAPLRNAAAGISSALGYRADGASCFHAASGFQNTIQQ